MVPDDDDWILPDLVQDRAAAELAEDGRILAALEEARSNLAWTLVAIREGMPESADRLTNTMYDTLRARLCPQELLRAVFTLLMPEGERIAADLVVPLSDDDVEEVSQIWAEQGYGTTSGT